MKRRVILCGFFLIIFLVGCGGPEIEGVILEVDNEHIMLAENLSQEAYEEIKDELPITLQNETVAGERDLDLIDLTYEHADELHKGDQVEVWLKGDIMLSFPPQAVAQKIKVKE